MPALFTTIMDALFSAIVYVLQNLFVAILNAPHLLFAAIMNTLDAIDHAALSILWIMLIYGRLDMLLAKSVKYKPTDPVEKPNYTPADFSIAVPTKQTPAIFLDCLHIWANNKPKEIIISTVKEELEKIEMAIDSDEALAGLRASGYIKVVYAPQAGKRAQLIEAIKHATGHIIAMTDDHIKWSETLLKGLAPCFEDAKVGACGTPIDVNIPKEQQETNAITGWEVALARMLFKRNAGLRVAHALANWCWCVAGPLGVYRAEIVQDPQFLEAFANDNWLFSKKMDVGDDNFLSRWVQAHGWTIAVQDFPGTTIERTARKDSSFINQILRWERSSVQHYIRTVFEVPQIWQNRWVAWKTMERLTRPFITPVHILAWVFAAWNHPWTTLAFVTFYICESLPSYWDFFNAYPYMRGHWFAVLATDYCYIVQDAWGWMTVWKTSWEERKLEKLEPIPDAGEKGATRARS